jgi:hypothetical protein
MQRLVKKCSTCKIEKDLDQFGVHKGRPDGLNYRCKQCVNDTAERGRRAKGMKVRKREGIPDGMRFCTWCEKPKSLNEFRDTGRRSGKMYVCESCLPEYNRDVWYKHKYGVSLLFVERLLDDQANRCASCGDPLENEFHLDHCHNTQAIRGILCRHCNIALGHLRDDPRRIVALLRYLEGQN